MTYFAVMFFVALFSGAIGIYIGARNAPADRLLKSRVETLHNQLDKVTSFLVRLSRDQIGNPQLEAQVLLYDMDPTRDEIEY